MSLTLSKRIIKVKLGESVPQSASLVKIEKLRAENAELKGVLDLKNDEYVKMVGTWKIINRLEEREKSFEGLLNAATAQMEKMAKALIIIRSFGYMTQFEIIDEAIEQYEQWKSGLHLKQHDSYQSSKQHDDKSADTFTSSSEKAADNTENNADIDEIHTTEGKMAPAYNRMAPADIELIERLKTYSEITYGAPAYALSVAEARLIVGANMADK